MKFWILSFVSLSLGAALGIYRRQSTAPIDATIMSADQGDETREDIKRPVPAIVVEHDLALTPPSVKACVDFAKTLSSSSVTELPALWAGTKGGSEGAEVTAMKQRLLAAQWSDSDPAGLAEAAHGDATLAETWAKVAPTAVLAWTDPGKVGEKDLASRMAAMVALTEADPKASLSLNFQIPGAEQSRGEALVARAVGLLAQKDRDDAWANTLLLPPGGSRRLAMDALALAWFEQAPTQAVSWAEKLAEPADRLAALRTLVRSTALKDPLAAVELWNHYDLGSVQDDTNTTSQLVRALAKVDLSQAWKIAKGSQAIIPGLDSTIDSMLSENRPQPSVGEICEAYSDLPDPYETELRFNLASNKGISATLKRWKPTDLNAAIQEAAALPESRPRTAVISYLGNLLGTPETPLTPEIMRQFPENIHSSLINSSLARATRQEDVAGIFNTMLLIQNPEARARQVDTTARYLAESQPTLAKEFFSKCPVETREEIAETLVARLAEHNPALALEITFTLPESNQDYRIYDALNQWAQRDSYQASEYVSKLACGGTRDSATAGLVQAISDRDPAAAVTWAASMTNPEGRACQLAKAFYNWGYEQIHRAKAQAAFTAMKLPVEEKNKVLQLLSEKQHAFPFHQ